MEAIYDDEIFFENYHKLRLDEKNYNDLIEQPVIYRLVGSAKGARALDIGCGYGNTCVWLKNNGADSVHGVDVSQRMIDFANANNSQPGITYSVMDACQLGQIKQKYDLVVSSLAFHYIENFDKLIGDIRALLTDGGRLIFSMEHPIYTSTVEKQARWIFDDAGKKTAFILDNYGNEGVRCTNWLDKEITKYHIKTETVINTLINHGFNLKRVVEPTPDKALMASYERTVQEYHRPAYLIISAQV